MIGAQETLEGGWNLAPLGVARPAMPGSDWHVRPCTHVQQADELAAWLLDRMESLGYREQDRCDVAKNLRGVWPAWFRSDDWRWNPRGVEASIRICRERTVLVLRPGADYGHDATARTAECKAAERSFRMHQLLMRTYSTWLRFDPRGRCVAICKYAALSGKL